MHSNSKNQTRPPLQLAQVMLDKISLNTEAMISENNATYSK
jgi:hypothetical protein